MDALSEPDSPEVLCSITTAASISDPPMDWRTAIQDTARLRLKRFALFLTGLKPAERKNCYQLLLTHRLRHEFEIPFVHARSDMHPDEYRLLMHEFGADRFNLHRSSQEPLKFPLPDELRSRIYIENAWLIEESDLHGFAGVCLDFSHLESILYRNPEEYEGLISLLERFPIGANHVSAFKLRPQTNRRRDRHFVSEPDDLDYLAGCPRRYFAKYVAIELSNPLEEQLAIKRRLETLLASR